MRRVLVIGPSGAGKSTVAAAVGARLGLPVHHLDERFWDAGWALKPAEERDALQAELLAADAWVIDGNYRSTMPARLARADTVVFVSGGRLLCAWRVIRRTWRHRGRPRHDAPDHCLEQFDRRFWRFLWYVLAEQPSHVRRWRRRVEASGVRCVEAPRGNLDVTALERDPGALPVLLGVDVGGTFTDAALWDGARLWTAKALTTAKQADGVMAVVSRVLKEAGSEPTQVTRFAHGTTVATNALLERRGARVTACLTAGFEDVLELGRQRRPSLYHLDTAPARVPVTSAIAVAERTRVDGVALELTEAEIERVVHEVARADPQAVAICLLHSWKHAEHEAALAAALRTHVPHAHVVASHELAPVPREFERAATTVLDAYLTPVLGPYLRHLAGQAVDRGLPEPLLMASSGGLGSISDVGGHAARAVLSGPAGGLVAATRIAQQWGQPLLCMDVGGTSCDVAVVGGDHVETAPLREVDGLPLQLPSADLHTVGAGGSSIVWIDTGGALRVGPHSAGSIPGPASYAGGGTQPTLTDAHVVVGTLAEDTLRDAGVDVSCERALSAFASLGGDPEVLAASAIELAVTHMAEAARVVSVARGLDPEQLALLAYGGAGALHACAVADLIGARVVLVPSSAGVLSAVGLMCADEVEEVEIAVHSDVRTANRRTDLAGRIAAHAQQLATERSAARVDRLTVSARYRGQGHSIPLMSEVSVQDIAAIVPVLEGVDELFSDAHERRFGHRLDRPVEIESVRISRHTPVETPSLLSSREPQPQRTLDLPGGARALAIDLRLGTVLVPNNWQVDGERAGCLVLRGRGT